MRTVTHRWRPKRSLESSLRRPMRGTTPRCRIACRQRSKSEPLSACVASRGACVGDLDDSGLIDRRDGVRHSSKETVQIDKRVVDRLAALLLAFSAVGRHEYIGVGFIPYAASPAPFSCPPRTAML